MSNPIDLRSFEISDSFWKNKMELVRTEVIPYQWEILNDRVEGAAPSFCMRNFKIAGKLMKQKKEQGNSFVEPVYTFRGFEALPEDPNHLEDRFYGFVFQDSDFAKWLEAVSYSLCNHPDEALEALADEAISIVCDAQLESGYLDTYYIINGMDKAFHNLRDHHELYCFGHLTEAAVAYYEATGKDKLLNAVIRFANYLVDIFGEDPNKCKGYPGHEIAEMALIRLYEVTKDDRYLSLCNFFLNERGQKPFYWESESHPNPTNYFYHQAHLPVREQEEAVGHAVRAVYLYSGMADAARINHDDAMWNACKKLWHSVTKEKLYITGGIGGTSLGEAFSFPFDLPNDLAYAETCASIGLIFWARRMLQMETNSEYADVMELALYNTVLSGMALDGKSFFYVNPLEVLPEACHRDERKFHVKPVRQKWFGCACCPPNLARLISSLPSYAFTTDEDTLYVHLYLGGKYKFDSGDSFELISSHPWDEKVTITYHGAPRKHKLALRIPGWCKNWKIETPSSGGHIENGYYYIEETWKDGDSITLITPMEITLLQADSRIRENIGKVAILRGPIVYCLEEVDNGSNLPLVRLLSEETIERSEITIDNQVFPALIAKGERQNECRPQNLYCNYEKPVYTPCEITLIPYFTWANRGENEMSVWISTN